MPNTVSETARETAAVAGQRPDINVPITERTRVPGRSLVLTACLIATFMAAIESTIVATTLPTIVGELGGFDLFSWVFTIFLLTEEGQKLAYDTWKIDLHFMPGSKMGAMIADYQKRNVKFKEVTVQWWSEHPEIDASRSELIKILTTKE